MSGYVLSVIASAGIWAILTLSLNVVTGYAGQVSLGQAAFFAIGAYAAAMLATREGASFVVGLLGGMAVTGVVAAALGLLALRVRDDFLVFATIGINFIVVALLQYTDTFGGSLGIVGIPIPAVAGVTLTVGPLAWLIVALTLAVGAALLWLERSWLGYGFAALRQDELAARAMGVPTALLKVVAFGVSGVVAGLSGALYAYYLGSVFPQNFVFIISIQVMAMLVLGGLGTVPGAIAGAAVLTALPELLRPLADYRYTIFGLVLVLTVSFIPGGLLGHGGVVARTAGGLAARLRPRSRGAEA